MRNQEQQPYDDPRAQAANKIKFAIKGYVTRKQLRRSHAKFAARVESSLAQGDADHVAMKELYMRAKEKNFSLQELFRVADSRRRNRIYFSDFKRILFEKEIILRRFTIRELERIISDPITHEVVYASYAETLLAHGMLKEERDHSELVKAFRNQVPRRICETLLKRGLHRPHIQAFCRLQKPTEPLRQKDLKRLLLGIKDLVLKERDVVYYLRMLRRKEEAKEEQKFVENQQLWTHMEAFREELDNSLILDGQDQTDLKTVHILERECSKFKIENFLSYLRSFEQGSWVLSSDFVKMIEQDLHIPQRHCIYLAKMIPESKRGEISLDTAHSFLKAHAYSRPSNSFLSEKQLSSRVPGWAGMTAAHRGNEVLKLVKRYLMVTHFAPEDVFEVALADREDPGVTQADLVSALVKLIGRLSPQTLQLSFPSFRKEITCERFKEMLREAGSYQQPVLFCSSGKLEQKYLRAFNNVADIKRILGKLAFDLHGDGGMTTAYFVSQLKVTYASVPKNYMSVLLGAILQTQEQERVRIENCMTFADYNCQESRSLALERKYLRYTQIKRVGYYVQTFTRAKMSQDLSFEKFQTLCKELRLPEKCVEPIFKLYSRAEYPKFTLRDFELFIKDQGEPELECEPGEVIRRVAQKIAELKQTPLSFLLPFEIWPRRRLSLLQLQAIFFKNTGLLRSIQESEAVFGMLCDQSPPAGREAMKSFEVGVLLKLLDKYTVERQYLKEEKLLLAKLEDFETFKPIRMVLEQANLSRKGFAVIPSLHKDLEAAYQGRLGRELSSKILKLMDINRSYGISVDEIQLFLMNYTPSGHCSLELEARRNALEMEEYDTNVKDYFVYKFGLNSEQLRGINEQDFVEIVGQTNAMAQNRLRVSQIEINSLINVLAVKGTLDFARLAERVERNLAPTEIPPPGPNEVRAIIKNLERETEIPLAAVFQKLQIRKEKEKLEMAQLRKQLHRIYLKVISPDQIDVLMRYMQWLAEDENHFFPEHFCQLVSEFSKEFYERAKVIKKAQDFFFKIEDTAGAMFGEANPKLDPDIFPNYWVNIQEIVPLRENRYSAFCLFQDDRYNQDQKFAIRTFVRDIDGTRHSIPKIDLKAVGEQEKKEQSKTSVSIVDLIKGEGEFKFIGQERGTLKDMMKKISQTKPDLLQSLGGMSGRTLSHKDISKELKNIGFNLNQRKTVLKQLAASEGTSVDNFKCSMDQLFDKIENVYHRQPSISGEINLIHKIMNTQVRGMLTTILEQVQLKPERDFYKGNSTILTSEFAALLRCEQIVASLHHEEDFFDTEFGPVLEDEGDQMDDQGRNGLYLHGQPPNPSYIHPDDIEWRAIPEIVQEYQDHRQGYCFFDQGPGSNDAKQGTLGDCWFISALSVIATRDALLCGFDQLPTESDQIDLSDEVINSMSAGVYPPLFHLYRKKGLYVFRFFKDFHWLYVLIDNRLPVNRNNNKIIFATCAEPREFWVPLMEKAFAKLHGCYGALISGFINEGLSDMSGLPAHSEKIRVKDTKSMIEFWEKLKQLLDGKTMMGCSRAGKTNQAEVIIDDTHTGLFENHAYSLLEAFIIEDSKNNRFIRLVRIRNPWGGSEWKGAWSDESPELEQFVDELDEHVKKLPKEELWQPGVNDGTFLMEFSDFCSIFTELYMCLEVGKQTKGFRYSCEWNSSNNTGAPAKSEESQRKWLKNHQFLIRTQETAKFLIQLQQPDARMTSQQKFPFSDKYFEISFAVIRIGDTEFTASAYERQNILRVAKFRYQKLASERITLTKGNYVILPFTNQPGKRGRFFLTIYSDRPEALTTKHGKGASPPVKAKLILSEEEQFPNAIDTSKGEISKARMSLIKERYKNLMELGDKEKIVSVGTAYDEFEEEEQIEEQAAGQEDDFEDDEAEL